MVLDAFEQLDATIFTNACGPCIGQWARYSDPKNAPKNSMFILSIETLQNVQMVIQIRMPL